MLLVAFCLHMLMHVRIAPKLNIWFSGFDVFNRDLMLHYDSLYLYGSGLAYKIHWPNSIRIQSDWSPTLVGILTLSSCHFVSIANSHPLSTPLSSNEVSI